MVPLLASVAPVRDYHARHHCFVESLTTGKLVHLSVSHWPIISECSATETFCRCSTIPFFTRRVGGMGDVLGALLAWIVARTNTPGKTLVELMPLYPILMPPIMKNIAWILLLAPKSGILNNLLQQYFGIETHIFNAFSMAGMVWVFGLACVPLGYLFLLPIFLSFDPSLEESAYIAGSRPVHTTLRITFRLHCRHFVAWCCIFSVACGRSKPVLRARREISTSSSAGLRFDGV
jgi:hypothetical protein